MIDQLTGKEDITLDQILLRIKGNALISKLDPVLVWNMFSSGLVAAKIMGVVPEEPEA